MCFRIRDSIYTSSGALPLSMLSIEMDTDSIIVLTLAILALTYFMRRAPPEPEPTPPEPEPTQSGPPEPTPPEPSPAGQPLAPEPTTQSTGPPEPPSPQRLFWISAKGSHWHRRYDCSGLRNATHEITPVIAPPRKRKPCKLCAAQCERDAAQR